MSHIQRGEVYSVMPDPSVGKEIQKKRPCVVVSANPIHANAEICVVCPITDALGKSNDIVHIPVPRKEGGLSKDSTVLCIQLKAVDVERLMEKMGNLTAETMQKIDRGLKATLSL